MSVPESMGGTGSSLVDLTLVAEEYGRRIAPVPFIEASVAARAMVAAGAPSEMLDAAAAGERIYTLALMTDDRQLVPAGSIADGAIVLSGDELAVVEPHSRPSLVPNQGAAPLAWWDVANGTRTVLAKGDHAKILHGNAVKEWKLLSSAALVGCGDAAVKVTVEYAKVREAFGQPIGTFQAVANALVDAAVGIESARRLTWKAAWYLDNEPDSEPSLVSMAFLHASESANRAVTAGVHYHGGTGYMAETDITLYFRRVKAWSVIGGDPRSELWTIADSILGRAHNLVYAEA
jgi:alkylation response protein AidB-like acyl-CoA dehydrogenase